MFQLSITVQQFFIISLMISDSDIRYPISDIRSVCLDNIRYPIPESKIAIRRPIGRGVAGGLEQGSWGLGRVSKGLGAWGLERA